MVSKLAMATAFALSFLLLPAHAETPACMEVGGTATSRFTGRLTRPVFPGPPNYEDVRRGDAREPAYILTLDRPACVNAAGDDNLSRQSVSQIHLRLDPGNAASRPAYAALRPLIGRTVTIAGTDGFGAQTGHHRAPLVLTVTGAAAASRAGAR